VNAFDKLWDQRRFERLLFCSTEPPKHEIDVTYDRSLFVSYTDS